MGRPAKRQKSEEARKQRYDRLKALFPYVPLLLEAAFIPVGDGSSFGSSLLAAAGCVCVCIFSGHVSYLHWKLPEKYHGKPDFLSFRCLNNIHSVVFVIFVVFSTLLFANCILLYPSR